MKDLLGNAIIDGDTYLADEGPVDDYAGNITRGTDAGVYFDDGLHKVWLPKTKILVDGEPGPTAKIPHARQTVMLTIPDWLAKERGLIR